MCFRNNIIYVYRGGQVSVYCDTQIIMTWTNRRLRQVLYVKLRRDDMTSLPMFSTQHLSIATDCCQLLAHETRAESASAFCNSDSYAWLITFTYKLASSTNNFIVIFKLASSSARLQHWLYGGLGSHFNRVWKWTKTWTVWQKWPPTVISSLYRSTFTLMLAVLDSLCVEWDVKP